MIVACITPRMLLHTRIAASDDLSIKRGFHFEPPPVIKLHAKHAIFIGPSILKS